MNIPEFIEYAKQHWFNKPSKTTPITAERLNHIEEGIATNNKLLKELIEATTQLNSDIIILKAQSLTVTTNASGDFGLDKSTKDITIISATPKDSWVSCSLCVIDDKWGIHSQPNTTFRLNYIYY